MNEIALHIDFLLHTNDCVIVPGLGGFVVNVSNIERSGLWGLNAPSCEIVFNNKLTYNDGLLAESLMRINNISFHEASKRIESGCEQLKKQLLKGQEVEWKNLGKFSLLNNHTIIFESVENYNRPQYFGLSDINLKPKSLLSSKTTVAASEENLIPVKAFISFISSGIVAAILMFIFVVSYNNSTSNNQNAEMISKSLVFENKIFKNSPKNSNHINNTAASYINSNEIEVQSSLPPKSDNNIQSNELIVTEIDNTESEVRYFIITGVYEVPKVAAEALEALQSLGYHSASMIKKAHRSDVYVNSFVDKNEAKEFMNNFKKQNTRYRDAWLLEYKVK